MTEWYDQMFEEERAEMAELEYSEALLPTDDLEDEIEETCTCDVSERTCEVHNIKDDEEISS
jgi:hypothetical protein